MPRGETEQGIQGPGRFAREPHQAHEAEGQDAVDGEGRDRLDGWQRGLQRVPAEEDAAKIKKSGVAELSFYGKESRF